MSDDKFPLISRLSDVVTDLKSENATRRRIANMSAEDVKSAITFSPLTAPTTKLKLEEMLVLCWSSVNEARGSSTEWLSLVSSVDSLRVGESNLLAEIEQLDVHKQHELDASERALLASIDTVSNYASVDTMRADDLKAYQQRYFDAEARQKSIDAVRATGLPTFRRDEIAGQPTPYANSTDPTLNKFGAGKVYEGAVEAQIWQQERSNNMTETQLAHQVNESRASANAAYKAVPGYEAQLEVIDATRLAAISRVAALKVQLTAVQSRLHSSEIDWNERAVGLLMRFTAATSKLGAYGQSLIACLQNVYPDLIPQPRVSRFLALVSPGQTSVGAFLEEVMVFLHDLEAGLVAIQLRTVQRQLTLKIKVKVENGQGSVTFPVALDTLPNVENVRLRGVSAFLPTNEDGLYDATITAPSSGIRATDAINSLDQVEVGEIGLGLLRPLLSQSSDLIHGANQCWNASPFGDWTLVLIDLSSENISKFVDVLIGFHVDYVVTT